jgi:hypothetical protein
LRAEATGAESERAEARGEEENLESALALERRPTTGTESAARATASTAIITALFIFIIYPSPLIFDVETLTGFLAGQ